MSDEQALTEDEPLDIHTSVKDTSQWSREDKKKLLKAVVKKGGISITKSYKNVESSLKWGNIKVDGKSAEECKAMYQKLIRRVRKYRTMPEIIADAIVSIDEQETRRSKETYKKKYLKLKKKYEEERKIFNQARTVRLHRSSTSSSKSLPTKLDRELEIARRTPRNSGLDSRTTRSQARTVRLHRSSTSSSKSLPTKLDRELEIARRTPRNSGLDSRTTRSQARAVRLGDLPPKPLTPSSGSLSKKLDREVEIARRTPRNSGLDSRTTRRKRLRSDRSLRWPNADYDGDTDDPQPSSLLVAPVKRKSELQLDCEGPQKKKKYDNISKNPIVPAQNNTLDKDAHLSMPTPEKSNAGQHNRTDKSARSKTSGAMTLRHEDKLIQRFNCLKF